jgi:hypothetical protein
MGECFWSDCGMILTGENRSTGGETSPIVASFLVRKKSLKILYNETLKNNF